MWNDYVWDMYKQTSGKDTIKMFQRNLSENMDSEYPEEIAKLMDAYVISENTKHFTNMQLNDLLTIGHIDDLEEWGDFAPEEISDVIDDWFLGWCLDVTQEKDESHIDYKVLFEIFIENIASDTTSLSIFCPGKWFIPYYFFSTYIVLERIADSFDIVLPALPIKSDYKGRLWHYANICKALYLFRLEKKLSFYELCAFLYDFGPKYVGGIDCYIEKDLPAPKSAYFVAGGGRNQDAVAENDPDKLEWWQCNPETRAGDMVVMYLRTPISSISSIWRAYSVGFIDPFFYFYRTTYIGHPVKITRIPLAKLKSDKVLGKMAIVRKNLQGINGCELMPSEYNRIIDLGGVKIERLEYVMEKGNEDYPNEKAVEEKLIKPLLKKIGYVPEDYTRQMRIEIGNHNHALIPDFVIYPRQSKGHQSGDIVIEAKRSIRNKKELEDAKGQVRGYAKLLGTRYSAVISMEHIYVMEDGDDYTKEIFSESWDRLKNTDVLYRLKKMIGK